MKFEGIYSDSIDKAEVIDDRTIAMKIVRVE